MVFFTRLWKKKSTSNRWKINLCHKLLPLSVSTREQKDCFCERNKYMNGKKNIMREKLNYNKHRSLCCIQVHLNNDHNPTAEQLFVPNGEKRGTRER